MGLIFDKNTGAATTLVMVETDGSDACLPNQSFCGIIAKNLAQLSMDVFKLDVSMSMDQGGSTTLWIDGENPSKNGVVSRATNTEPAENEGARNIANGLFIELI